MKAKLTYKELIEQKLKEKGITTNKHADDEIIEILSKRNFYYRISSYRKNFKVNKIGKYIGLDFEALVDMASFDTYLREYFFSLTLDVEHNAKTLLMNLITNDPNEDGYSILEDFKNRHPSNESFYDNALKKFGKNSYLSDMHSKRSGQISVWVFLEIVDLGTLIKFLNFYHHRKRNSEIKQYDRTLKFVKNIRNACAHNNIYFINIFSNNLKIKGNPIPEILTFGKQMKIKESQMVYLKINDLIALFYLHKKFSSSNLNERRHKEGLNAIARMTIKEHLYSSSEAYKRFLVTLTKMIDFLK